MLKADLFEAEYLADEHPVLVPTDVAAIVHSSCQVAWRVDELDQCARKYHGAGLVNAAGRLIVQSLVRPFVVEHLPELIELLLLKPQRERWRLCRVLFESAVHPLMASVLLRPAWLNALMHDAHLHPSKRQLRQAKQASTREWGAVVGSDSRRHSILAHSCFTDRSYLTEVHSRDDLAANQIAAVSVGDGEWIGPSTVSSVEVALEVHAPELVRRRHLRERFRVGRSPVLLFRRTG